MAWELINMDAWHQGEAEKVYASIIIFVNITYLFIFFCLLTNACICVCWKKKQEQLCSLELNDS